MCRIILNSLVFLEVKQREESHIYWKKTIELCDKLIICCTLCVYLLYYVYIAVLTLDAELLAISQYPEGPATGHFDTGCSWFPSVYKQMLRWFPSFQVATTCLSCSPPHFNFLVTFFSYLSTCKITTVTG